MKVPCAMLSFWHDARDRVNDRPMKVLTGTTPKMFYKCDRFHCMPDKGCPERSKTDGRNTPELFTDLSGIYINRYKLK